MNDVSEPRGPAIEGYDPVAYFEQGRPITGSPDHTLEYEGATWLFSTAEHLRAFQASPERFVPAYLGQCSFATSLGKTESGDPTKWEIRDGRLFLNSNAVAGLLWKFLPGRVKAADRNWKAGGSARGRT